MQNLVIVESPAKAKTIEKFLGKDYIVKSSFGHIRDLAKKGLGVDIEQNFAPCYEISAEKKKVVDELSKLAKKVDAVWLASDEDREGEAIAWHLTEVLGLPVERTRRIVFHEITKNAILKAIENPRTVDLNLVNAQQARRVLDRIVGFELSPILWKKVKPALSAGRVQSVAVRLIVERERDIIAHNSTSYYRVVAQFYSVEDEQKTLFKAEYSQRFADKEQALAMLERCKQAEFTVVHSEVKPTKRYPAPPFTTSTLQQEAARKFGMSVSQTMSVAQRLYEQGLITYMRTDSVNLSQLAINACKKEVTELFGEKYSNPRNYTTHSKGAQEAHEAIRPSYIDRREIEGTAVEKRLYDLIWKRTVASQMVPADIDRTTINIAMSGSEEHFVATGDTMRFDGFMRLYSESVEEENQDGEQIATLPHLKEGERVKYHSVVATERFTQPPMRYNEASLVKRLEELGIGRPSTYAPTISTIITRGYVEKSSRPAQKRNYTALTLRGANITEKVASESYGTEKNRLSPTDIGMVVNDYLEAQFAMIMDYNFTANVEKEFDRIADGELQWVNMIETFYTPFHKMVDAAIGTQVTTHQQAVRELGVDPTTGHTVKARIGRYGPMVEIEAAEGGKPQYASLKKGQLIESITLEEALELFALPRTVGVYEGEEVVVGIGKFGGYVRYGKSFASLAKSDDPYTVSYERAVELIRQQQEQAAAANVPLKTFAEDKSLVIKNGRYGAYIAYKGKNYRLPKGVKPESATYEACMKIVNSSKK
ncbi:MAG: type I DNA topoisomerase [Alistipes sp.]|nr:type I DNA topoisomerase [Alistipes sp.]